MVNAADSSVEGESEIAAGRPGNLRWTVCAMLFIATSINYMDRQVIAILKPTLEQSIGMSESDYGFVVGAFTFAYALGLLLAGRLVDRVGTRIGYIVIMAVWSLSAMGHALASSVIEFAVARFSLGLGEAGNFPAAIKTVTEWFPQSERSLATGIFNSGTNLGAVLAPLIVPWVTVRYGWHAAFLVTGAFSAMWIVLWFFKYHKPGEHPALTAAELRHIGCDSATPAAKSEQGSEPGCGSEPAQSDNSAPVPWIKLLSLRQTWAFSAGKFLTDPIWWFYLYWLPSYFSTKFHLDLSHLGLPLIIIYNASALGSIGGGWLPTPFRNMGLSAEKARLAAMLLCASLVTPVFLINYLDSQWCAIGLLSLAAAAHQGWSANLFTTASDMFPRSIVGSVTGIGGMAGSLGGFLLATSTGIILQVTHSYASLFAMAASAYLLALAIMLVLAPGFKKVEFAV